MGNREPLEAVVGGTLPPPKQTRLRIPPPPVRPELHGIDLPFGWILIRRRQLDELCRHDRHASDQARIRGHQVEHLINQGKIFTDRTILELARFSNRSDK